MSDHTPFDIQAEILKRLRIKSILQFRSVSKTWKSLIDSSEFISGPILFRHRQPYHLFTRFEDFSDYIDVSFVDDDTFPRRYSSHNVPLTFKRLNDTRIIGSTHGLFCLYGNSLHGQKMFVVWNPVIKRSVDIGEPSVIGCGPYETCFGFGVCHDALDPKIINITLVRMCRKVESRTHIPWQVDIFTFGSGSWRSFCNNIPRKSTQFGSSQVIIDGFIYWHAFDRITVGNGFKYGYKNVIILFDIVTENFSEFYFPNTLAYRPPETISVSKLRESVVVIERSEKDFTSAYGVWMIGDGVPNSFTKLFTVKSPHTSIRTCLLTSSFVQHFTSSIIR